MTKTEQTLKVGDYVELIGIVYEDGSLYQSGGKIRIQTADGTKYRSLSADHLVPASPKSIKRFEAEAAEGVTPEAIIAREAEETEKQDQGEEGEGDGEEGTD